MKLTYKFKFIGEAMIVMAVLGMIVDIYSTIMQEVPIINILFIIVGYSVNATYRFIVAEIKYRKDNQNVGL